MSYNLTSRLLRKLTTLPPRGNACSSRNLRFVRRRYTMFPFVTTGQIDLSASWRMLVELEWASLVRSIGEVAKRMRRNSPSSKTLGREVVYGNAIVQNLSGSCPIIPRSKYLIGLRNILITNYRAASIRATQEIGLIGMWTPSSILAEHAGCRQSSRALSSGMIDWLVVKKNDGSVS